MTKKKVFIIGAAGHAKVIIDIFEKDHTYEIIGLIDVKSKVGQSLVGYPILGTEEDLPKFIEQNPDSKIFIAIGDGWVRHLVVERIKKIIPDVSFANAIHPSAIIAKGVKIGVGIAIMAGSIINTDSVIGDFVILNTNSSLDHDGVMDDFSTLSPNAVAGGGVSIGAFSVVSIGAVILHGKSIGTNSIIGAGAVLTKNCESNVTMYGIPARKIRSRIKGEKYL